VFVLLVRRRDSARIEKARLFRRGNSWVRNRRGVSERTRTMAPAKKKRGSTKDNNATATTDARRKRQKRQRALSLMQSFLQNQLGETVAASSPAFVQAVTLCHERFLHVVAAELASASQGDAGVQRVTASHVEAAMRELGMEDLLQEAKTVIAANSGGRKNAQPSKATRKKKNRSKQFTEEEIAEQERLLASSKDKVENG